MDPERATRILAFLSEEGLIRPDAVQTAPPASFKALQRIHDPEYLDALQGPGALTPIVGFSVGEAEQTEILALQRRMVGATMAASQVALRARGMAINLGGGLHHAHRGMGRGFCVFNDVAVAIEARRSRGFSGRVLVIDLDLHDGDGTRSLFRADLSVHTFSLHNEDWDDASAVESTSIALGSDVEDHAYLAALKEHLPPVIQRFAPELVIYLAGCDPAGSDRLGNWRITPEGMAKRDRFVVQQVRGRSGACPLVVVLAGGYGDEAWRYSARFFGWLCSGAMIEPPTTDESVMLRYHHLRALVPADQLRDDEAFHITEQDILPELGGHDRRTRLLDYYSTHGVELALERYGILDKLRKKGFHQPTIAFDLRGELGDTLQVYGNPDRRELLVELRMRRDRKTVSGAELLAIEWLLMQDPRARFDDPSRRLPGQEHPGLGLFRDVGALLVLVCERLQLDGISFVPSHYHLAVQFGGLLRFIDPHLQARFEAMQACLGGVPLAAASRIVHEGRLRRETTGEVLHWRPAPMVAPVSDRLRKQLFGRDYELQVRRERSRLGALRVRRDTDEPAEAVS